MSALAVTLVPLAAATSTSWMMYAGIGAVGLGLLGLLILLVPFERTLTTQERVQQYAALLFGATALFAVGLVFLT